MSPPIPLGVLASSRVAAAAGDPILSIPNLVGYYRSEDVTEANGVLVPTWVDASGSGNHAVATGAFPRVYDSQTPTGERALSTFNSAGMFLAPYGIGDVLLSASSTHQAVYHAARAFGTTGNPWLSLGVPSVGSPQWLRLSYRTPTVLTSISFQNASSGTRAPKDFTIQGSNDGSSWTVLGTYAGVTWAGVIQNFAFTNSTAYAHYQIHITACAGSDKASLWNLRPNGGASPYVVNSGEAWAVIKPTAEGGMPVQPTAHSLDTFYPYAATAQVLYGFGNIDTRSSVTPTVAVTNLWHVARFYADASGHGFEIDGVSQHTLAKPAAHWDQLRIGGQPARAFQGPIAAAAIFNARLSSGDATALLAELRSRYITG